MSDTMFGRGPNGRALRKDGTERKERKNLSPLERIEAVKEIARKAYASIGRGIFGKMKGLQKFVSGIGTFRRWIREAQAFSTEEKRAERRAYHERQIALIDEKGRRAAAWLPGAEKAKNAISGLYASIGEAMENFVKENGRAPTDEEVSNIVGTFLSDDIRKIVEDANDPANDVFVGLRRGDDVEESNYDDNDTL